jgi:hypothetical protein
MKVARNPPATLDPASSPAPTHPLAVRTAGLDEMEAQHEITGGA